MSELWCESAWLGDERAEPSVVIELDGERIGAVRTGEQPPDGAERLPGLTLPGFANSHSHAFHRALRGRTHAERGSFWTWREQMYEVAARLDPDSYLALARATFAEMALAGISCVGEFHYLHHGPGGEPYAEPNAMGAAVIAAADQAGVRITLIDACYLHGGFDTKLEGTQLRFGDGRAEKWAQRVEAIELSDPARARLGAAIHSVRAVDPGSAAAVAAFAAERSIPLHAHVSEQPAENAACRAAYELTPTALLAEAGALGSSFTAVHATHLTDADIGLLGGATCSCCFCPTTERDLADGVGPARKLTEAGAQLTLGSDSHAVVDMFEEARAVELDERLASGERGGHGGEALLHAATAQGHASLGWPEAGRIEPGAFADLTTMRLDSPRLAGTSAAHALDSVVFASTAADVVTVIHGGRRIVNNGVHMNIDVAGELQSAIAAVTG